MNDIIELGAIKGVKAIIISTSNKNNWFSHNSLEIFRFGIVSNFKINRYLNYFIFNISTFFKLIFFRPKLVVVYETLSVLPLFYYLRLCKNIEVLIHHHEYISPQEINNSSSYFKYLISVEKKLYSHEKCKISHTNSDRKELFLKDHQDVSRESVNIYPNLPPKSWYEMSEFKILKDNKPIKMVHVGAIGLEGTYLAEIVDFIISNSGKYILDLYVSNIDSATEIYLDKLLKTTDLINKKKAINYFELPNILKDYHLGLVLYKGSIPNHVYSIPNKIYEYLACRLEVWYSDKLISTTKFVDENSINGCTEVDFTNLDNTRDPMIVRPNNDHFFFNENSVTKINKILQC